MRRRLTIRQVNDAPPLGDNLLERDCQLCRARTTSSRTLRRRTEWTRTQHIGAGTTLARMTATRSRSVSL